MAELQKLADLTDERHRMAMLEELVKQLSFNERNALVHIVSKCNDGFPALPVELILEILGYLPILQLWTLQLVCKQWRLVLSSDRILRSTLARWESHHHSDSARNLQSDPVESIRSKLRRMQAMRLGRPFTSRLFQDSVKVSPGVLITQTSRTFALKGRRVAYIRSQRAGADSVVVLDMVSGDETTFSGAARERIMSLCCTSSVIAFVTYSGKLYVSVFADPTSTLRTMTLPSAAVTAFHADEDIICLALRGVSEDIFTLAVYDCSTHTLRAHDLSSPTITVRDAPSNLSPKALLVDARKQVVDIFSQKCVTFGAYGGREDVFVEHRRYSFNGEQIRSSAWDRLGTPRSTKVPFELGDLHTTGEPGQYILRTKLLQSSDASDWSSSPTVPLPVSLLYFDAKAATISEHRFKSEHQRPYPSHLGDYTSLTLWKDVEVRAVGNLLFTSTENDESLWTTQGRYRLRNGINMVKHSGVSRRARESIDDTGYSVLVNDTFIVGLEQEPTSESGHCVKIFCFDEDLRWAGARSTRLWELDANQACKFESWDGSTPPLPL